MLKNCLRRKSFLFFVWGSGRSVPDPFCGAKWGREGADFAVERNGAGGVGAMAEAWYMGRPAGLVLGGPGPFGAGWCSWRRGPGARRCSVGQRALGRAG